MSRFHVGEDGVPRKCDAKINCPVSGTPVTENHYENKEDARAGYERSQGEQMAESLKKFPLDRHKNDPDTRLAKLPEIKGMSYQYDVFSDGTNDEGVGFSSFNVERTHGNKMSTIAEVTVYDDGTALLFDKGDGKNVADQKAKAKLVQAIQEKGLNISGASAPVFHNALAMKAADERAAARKEAEKELQPWEQWKDKDMRNHPDFGKFDEQVEMESSFGIDENGNVVKSNDSAPETVYLPDTKDVETYDGWSAVSGFSNNGANSGPFMESNEVISGSGMEKFIRENPGTYALVNPQNGNYDSDKDVDGYGVDSDDNEVFTNGWVLLKKDPNYVKPPYSETTQAETDELVAMVERSNKERGVTPRS